MAPLAVELWGKPSARHCRNAGAALGLQGDTQRRDPKVPGSHQLAPDPRGSQSFSPCHLGHADGLLSCQVSPLIGPVPPDSCSKCTYGVLARLGQPAHRLWGSPYQHMHHREYISEVPLKTRFVDRRDMLRVCPSCLYPCLPRMCARDPALAGAVASAVHLDRSALWRDHATWYPNKGRCPGRMRQCLRIPRYPSVW